MANDKHDHYGHRLRVKERFRKEKSFDSFEPHNILEYLLFFSIPQGDTNNTAHRLINHFGSYWAVLDASYDELIKVKGIGPHTADLITSILPLARAYFMEKNGERIILDKTEKIIKYLSERYIGYTEEVASVISLDNCCNLISFDILSRGGVDSVAFDIRNLIKVLLRTGAKQAILAHNHPGGLALPSDYDATATKTAVKACGSMGIWLKDHIILSGGDSVSMKDSKEYKNFLQLGEEYEEDVVT